MKWIVGLQLTFGILFAWRTLRQLVVKKRIERQTFATIACATIAILGAIAFHFRDDQRLLSASLLLFLFALSTLDAFFRRRLETRARKEFPGFLNGVILTMKSGVALRAAIERELADGEDLWRRWLRATIQSNVFLHQASSPSTVRSHPDWREWIGEIRVAHELSHHGLPRLENLRRRLKIMSDFRRKSGQALIQVRIQLIVMTVLYFALLTLTMMRFKVSDHRMCLAWSGGLFAAGQLTFWLFARKTKWKV